MKVFYVAILDTCFFTYRQQFHGFAAASSNPDQSTKWQISLNSALSIAVF